MATECHPYNLTILLRATSIRDSVRLIDRLMPEGPEVRKYADALHSVLTGRRIRSFEARTRDAKIWLKENESRLIGRVVRRVTSHGKHLLGYVQGGFYFHSHLMMWGRWETYGGDTGTGRHGDAGMGRRGDAEKRRGGEVGNGSEPKNIERRLSSSAISKVRKGGLPPPNPESRDPQHDHSSSILPDKDRRERARIVVDNGAVILLSAPIFNVGQGDPYEQIENLATLGPDVLPVNGTFKSREFQRRLLLPEHHDITIGAAILNQRILAGLGNYLRAEVLFDCGLNPWRKVGELTKEELQRLSRTAPELARRSYLTNATATEEDRDRMRADSSLVYQPGREMGTRHLVFRRTNLPCLRCGTPIKQLRQATFNPEQTNDREESAQAEERTRIVYFCPTCQKTDLQKE